MNLNKSSLLKRHPVKTVALLFFLLAVFLEVALRIVFAVKDYPVGALAPSWLAFKPVDSLQVWDSFYMDENGIYKAGRDYWNQDAHREWTINSEGFRGREFIPDSLNDSAISLLLIGDSYTWGAHAEPPDRCFADLLDKDEKFICYNAGIPGTDPAQYAQVAKTYVPRLKPEYTLVILYLGNDLMDSVRPIVSHKNIYYQTTAGWLPVSYKGRHFASARESYEYVTNKFSPHSLWENIILKTAIGTAALTFPLRMEEYAEWRKRKNSSVTNDYLKEILAVCRKNNSSFRIFIIPREADLKKEFYRNPLNYISRHYPKVISGLESRSFVFPFKKEHLYPQPDGHLNNAGHAFAADFIRLSIASGE